jgi:hypothetical protein
MAIVITVINQSVTIIKGIFFLIMTLIFFKYKKEISADQVFLKT